MRIVYFRQTVHSFNFTEKDYSILHKYPLNQLGSIYKEHVTTEVDDDINEISEMRDADETEAVPVNVPEQEDCEEPSAKKVKLSEADNAALEERRKQVRLF